MPCEQALALWTFLHSRKVEVSGGGSRDWLDGLVPNRLPGKDGGIILTHFLNDAGRIELEATIVRFDENRYYIVCAAFFEQRLIDHLNAREPTADISIINRSYEWGALSLNGPRSRDVLAQCTTQPLTNEDFPWLNAKEISIGNVKCWAMRLSYAGELGWEIHASKEGMQRIYAALWSAGESHGISNYGSFAMNSMRMEKMFQGAGELTNEVTLPEANVMRFAKLDKDFVGKEATVKSNDGDLPWVCAYLSIEPNGVEDGHGGEAVLLNGEVVGSTSSMAFGHHVGSILAFAYVKPFAAKAGTELEVVIAGEARKARVHDKPLYDAASQLPRTA